MGKVSVDTTVNNVLVNTNPVAVVNAYVGPANSAVTAKPMTTATVASPNNLVQISAYPNSVTVHDTPVTVNSVVPGGNVGSSSLSQGTLLALAMDPETLIEGLIVRSAHGAITSATVQWPDGTGGTYTGVESTTWPGAIDSYTITYGSISTFTQPTVTRNSNGAVTTRPMMVVT